MRRWTFWGGTAQAWTGNLCDPHAPLDGERHLKMRALSSYMQPFPADLPDNVRCTGFDPFATVATEPCFVCEHEGRQAKLRQTIAKMCEQDDASEDLAGRNV